MLEALIDEPSAIAARDQQGQEDNGQNREAAPQAAIGTARCRLCRHAPMRPQALASRQTSRVRSGGAQRHEQVRWTCESDERRELERAAGWGLLQMHASTGSA